MLFSLNHIFHVVFLHIKTFFYTRQEMLCTLSHFFLYKSNTINNCKITAKKNVILFNRKNDLIEKKPYTTPPIIGPKIFDKEAAV